jgi:nucleotide-binding universal stress UspA family protein
LFEKILVPLDGSEQSLRALDVAVEVAVKFGSKLTLIYAYSVATVSGYLPEPSVTVGVPIMSASDISKLADSARKAGKKILDNGKKRIKASGVEVHTLLEEGHPVHETIRTAQEDMFGLIVMGARGLSHVIELLLGGVSDAIMHHAVCPVLIVK